MSWLTFDPNREDGEELQRHEGTPSLDDLQDAVGGMIEAVDIHAPDGVMGRRVSLYVNEEGRILDPPLEPSCYCHAINQVLRGPVVVAAVDEEGASAPLTEEDIQRVDFGPDHAHLDGYGTIPVVTYGGYG